ncbi:hypothetical protein Tco_1516477 [Tanacetum coccineum]
MDDPNITMEEYIRLEEKKLLGMAALSCEPTVSPLNDNEIDFRISFDKSNDEDYTVIFEENSFSYKIISVDNLKTDSENDNDKVNMPSFLSPEPTIRYFDDLDYLKDFKNEFSAILYNDALTSKSDYLNEPTVNPQHNNEINLKDETSLFEYDEEEQNVLYFNDQFPFNIIYPDVLNRMRTMIWVKWVEMGIPFLLLTTEAIQHMALPPGDQRHQYLRFEGLEYIDADIIDFELIACSIAGRSQAPEMVTVTDLFYLRGMDVGSVNIPYLLSRLQGLMVIIRDIPMIDIVELVRLQICEELDDTWAWVAPGPERQQVAAVGAPEAPRPPPAAGPARTMAQRIARIKPIIIMEYLVKISKKARILELKRRHLKITVLTSYTPYPSRKIRRIHQGRYGVSVPALHKKPRRFKDQYAVSRRLYTPYSI